MDKGHETFWLKKNEAVFKDDGTSTLRGNKYYPLFYKTIEPVEHEYFRCVSQKKMVELNSWDFDYCPFCGTKLSEKEQG